MKARVLVQSLHCPHCAAPLRVQHDLDPGAPDLRFAILRCACTTHPVLDGVVCIDRRSESGRFSPFDPAVERLRAGDAAGAVAATLAPCGRHFLGKLAAAVRRLERRPPPWMQRPAETFIRRRVLENPDLSFAAAVGLLRNEGYRDYLVHRFANPSLLAAVAVLLMLKEVVPDPGLTATGPRVLDLGGGAGHTSYLISRFFPSATVVLADRDFTVLYLARRFIAPHAMCVCVDAEAPLPFASGWFDAAFSLDCLHYVHSKAAVIAELLRALRHDGMLLLAHLHNALAPNPTAGIPLAPEDYRRLLAGIPHRLLSERHVLDDLLRRCTLDLRGTAEEELRRAPAFSVVAGSRPGLWREHDLAPLLDQCRADLALNPLYDVLEDGPVARLRTHWPSDSLKNECTEGSAGVPESLEIPRPVLDRLRTGRLTAEDDATIRPLVRSFAVVPLPDRYR